MSRPAGALGKRGKKFDRLVRKMEKENRISTPHVLQALFRRAIDMNPEHGAMANAAAKQYLDRCIGPTIHRVELDVAVDQDPLVVLLRQIARERSLAAELEKGSALSFSSQGDGAIEVKALPPMPEPPEES